MDSFDDRSILDVNMSDGHSNIVLDTHVQVVRQSCDSDIIELISTIYKIIVFVFNTRVK